MQMAAMLSFAKKKKKKKKKSFYLRHKTASVEYSLW